MNIQDLLTLKKVALVGATDNEEKFGHTILKFLQRKTKYDIYPVNPNLEVNELLGLKVYPTLRDIPEKVDMVIAVVPPKVTSQVLDEAIALQIPNFWCQPGASIPEIEKQAAGKINLIREMCIMVMLG